MSAPSSSSTPRHSSSNTPHRRQQRSILLKYMLQLYHRRPKTDIVQAIQSMHISGPLSDGARILEFSIPSVKEGQILETAELLGIAGAILKVQPFQDAMTRNVSAPDILRSRKEGVWRAFDVTSAVIGRSSDTVKFYVHGIFTYHLYGDGPILLLNYSKIDRPHRQPRSLEQYQERIQKRDQENAQSPMRGNSGRRRRRDTCRRRPMYVDFSTISYDDWVIAPLGYEAYQCIGKCYFPIADHLSPTTHAVVQTLVHSFLQQSGQNAENSDSNKVGRACCVPIRLEPTSLLYLDSKYKLIYEYKYKDMVVAECGCR